LIQQFHDKIRLKILEDIHQNCVEIDQFKPYDVTIDKRKYSHLKNWIVQRLEEIDVDMHYSWMSEMDRKIMTDSITPDEEKKLLREIKNYQHPIFFFTKFYELNLNYRHFLLIRMRYADHEMVEQFLNDHAPFYRQAKEIEEKIHAATHDIIDQYAQGATESKQWDEYLTNIFYDDKIDGLNRFMALVRLIFIGFNYRRFDVLVEKFDYLDQLFSKGQFYSKRLLLNYYSNRVMLHTKFQEWEKAAYYGHLSIREKNYDYLHYVNTLAAVLLRLQRNEEALMVMKTAYPDMKKTQSFHNRIGFVSFFIKCLNGNDQYRNAENFAESFLRAYKKEIFEHRWHLFFSVYLETLLNQKKYKKLIRVVRQHKLLNKEKAYQKRANYLPTILWYYDIGKFKEYLIDEQELIDNINTYLDQRDNILETKESSANN
jgi:hypothetical protein